MAESSVNSQINWRALAVAVLAIGGAFGVGTFGAMAAAFFGDASPKEFAMNFYMLWGVLGGASLGALPGLLVGRLLGMKGLARLLSAVAGTALGALAGAAMGEAATSLDVNGKSALYGGMTLAGAALGCLPAGLDLIRRYGGE